MLTKSQQLGHRKIKRSCWNKICYGLKNFWRKMKSFFDKTLTTSNFRENRSEINPSENPTILIRIITVGKNYVHASVWLFWILGLNFQNRSLKCPIRDHWRLSFITKLSLFFKVFKIERNSKANVVDGFNNKTRLSSSSSSFPLAFKSM